MRFCCAFMDTLYILCCSMENRRLYPVYAFTTEQLAIRIKPLGYVGTGPTPNSALRLKAKAFIPPYTRTFVDLLAWQADPPVRSILILLHLSLPISAPQTQQSAPSRQRVPGETSNGLSEIVLVLRLHWIKRTVLKRFTPPRQTR